MKTITQTLALLFATAAFTACTDQSIEPARPAAQMKSDTIHRLTQSSTEIDQQTRKYQSEKMVISEGIDQNNTPPAPAVKPVLCPVTVPAPRPAVMPVEQINALDK